MTPHRRRIALAVLAAVLLGLTALVVLLPGEAAEPEAGGLIILSGTDQSIGSQRERLVDEWNALHPDQPATIVELPESADSQRSDMLARAQSGDTGVDVYNLDATWTAEFSPYVLDLPDEAAPEGEFLEGPLRSARFEGRLQAVPFNTDVGLLYYNKDLLELVRPGGGPPASWDVIEEDVERLRQIAPGVTGFVGQLADYEGLAVNALEVVRGEGADVVDTDGGDHEGTVTLDEPALRGQVGESLARLRRIAEGPGGVPATTESDATRVFGSGQALYMRNWPLANRTLRQPDESGRPPVPFGITALPRGAGLLGGQNLAISAASDQPETARALIEFLTSEESQRTLMVEGGLLSTRSRPYRNPTGDPVVPLEGGTIEQVLQQARARPELVHYGRFSSTFRGIVDGVLRRGEALTEDDDARLEDAVLGRITPAPG